MENEKEGGRRRGMRGREGNAGEEAEGRIEIRNYEGKAEEGG